MNESRRNLIDRVANDSEMDEAVRGSEQLLFFKPTRQERRERMDEEILDVEAAADALGVSTRTVYKLARSGEIPAMRVGREWRLSLRNLREWVANASKADQVAAALQNGRMVRRQ